MNESSVELLKQLYKKTFDRIIEKQINIDLFYKIDLFFCDDHTECSDVTLKSDTLYLFDEEVSTSSSKR